MTMLPRVARGHGQRPRKLGVVVALLMLAMASSAMLAPQPSSGSASR
jgi:hypothetical protein